MDTNEAFDEEEDLHVDFFRPWPPKSAKTNGDGAPFARADAAWAAAEARLASSASADARLAAFWHRSELSTRDMTPLEPEEAAMKHALVAEAKRRRGGAN